MRKISKVALLSAVFVLSMSATAFAGQWKEDTTGWWWLEDDGTYPQNTWKWLDGNGDGIAECYYFDSEGYMASGTSVEGYQVDASGRWVQDGQVQFLETEARQALRAATEKSQALSSMEADYLMNMQVSTEGMSIDTNLTGNLKMKDAYTDQMQFIMSTDMNLLGQAVHADYFYVDGWYYYDMAGEKYKIPMDMTAAMESASAAAILDADQLSYIQGVSSAINADGSTTIYFSADGNKLTQMVQSVLGTMGADYTSMIDQLSMDLYKGELTLDTAGNVIQEKALLDMSINYEGTPLTYHIYMETNTKNPGQPVDFVLPSTEGYTDMTQVQAQ